MTDHSEKLFAAAVRSLADDAELQLAAVALLEKSADRSKDGADEAIARWESVDAAAKRRGWRWVFVAVLIGLSVWAWSVAGNEALVYSRLVRASSGFQYDTGSEYRNAAQMLDACLPERLTQHERWLLLGDTTKNTRAESMKSLWESAPDDPAFYLDCAFSESGNRRGGGLPVDFLETARRLDQGNSWPIYVAGSFEMNRAIKIVPLTSAESDAKTVRSWKILDQAKLDDCLALFHEASLQPRFDTYRSQWMERRKGLIPVDGHLGYLTAIKIFWLDWWGYQSRRSCLAVFLSTAAAKSQQYAAEGDKEGFVRLMADVELLNRRWLGSEIEGETEEFCFDRELRAAVPRLHASAVSLGLPEEMARLAGILNSMKTLREKANDQSPGEFSKWFENHSSMLLSEFWTDYSEVWYPKWTVEDLKPGRMADHELLSRGCCLVLWVIFGIGLGGLAAYQFRVSRLIRRLAVRIAELLDMRDHAWIIGAGVLLPYCFTMVINQLTPLGGRDWSISGNHLMLPTAQFYGMAVLMLLLSLFVARWRLKKKASVLGLGAERSRWGPRAVVCAAALIPVSGWFASREPDLEWYILFVPLAFFLIVFPISWLLANSFWAVFGSSGLRLLECAAISRALMPAYAVAMLLMVAAAPFHKAAERAWFRRDTTMTAVPEFPAVSPYDYAIAVQTRQNIREALGVR